MLNTLTIVRLIVMQLPYIYIHLVYRYMMCELPSIYIHLVYRYTYIWYVYVYVITYVCMVNICVHSLNDLGRACFYERASTISYTESKESYRSPKVQLLWQHN